MGPAQRYRYLWKPLVFAACCAPALLLFAGIYGIAGRHLGADPVEELLLTCGKTALNLLCLTLAVTPVATLAHRPQLLRLRRMLGLFAFTYVLLHFTVYLVLDRSLDAAMIAGDIAKRPYITVGTLAYALMIPLAITSTAAMIRRLGRRWQSLHRLVYATAMLGILHWAWLVKADLRKPLTFGTLLFFLLGARLVLWLRKKAVA